VAAEILEATGVDAELVEGKSGIFDVSVDGERIFSKRQESDRFPDPGEITTRMQEPAG
jgi:predicted Rdx family selenoprotein